MSNSKEGREVSKDPAPGLPTDSQRVFGESPMKRPITGRHPNPTRADATEEGNLRDENATAPLPP